MCVTYMNFTVITQKEKSDSLKFIFEIVGKSSKVDAFVKLMQPLGLVDVSRTGIAAIARGVVGMEHVG